MAKVNTTICLDPQAHALVLKNIENLSGFVNESIYAFCSGGLPDEQRKKIPIEKILEQQLREVTGERDALKAAYKKLEAEHGELNLRHKIMLVNIQHDRAHPMPRMAPAAPGIKKKWLAGQEKGKPLTDKQAKKMADQLRASLGKGKPETK